jgi:thiamine pyrophosphokinase
MNIRENLERFETTSFDLSSNLKYSLTNWKLFSVQNYTTDQNMIHGKNNFL